MKHLNVVFIPDQITVEVPAGITLLEAAGHAGIILATPCGGVGRCGKCKALLLPSKKEVLGCQYIINDNIQVEIPPHSRFFMEQILQHSLDHSIRPQPQIQKIVVDKIETFEQLLSFLSQKSGFSVVPDPEQRNLLQEKIAGLLNHPFTAVLAAKTAEGGLIWHLVELEPGNTSEKLFGLAIDIGTTTVAARLANLISGRVSAKTASGNPQSKYGADVVSRISYAHTSPNSAELQKSILQCINDLILKSTAAAGIQPEDIYEIVFAGNTTMTHLLLGYPVTQLGQAPFRAYSLAPANLSPRSLGLGINPAGNIHTMSNIAGFVGSDTVAAALACGLDISELNTLLVDIGTNGEIVLKTGNHLLACSCAAGPALEGAGIECGSRAQNGSIERVLIDQDDLDVSVIGGLPAHTICGSGLIDAVAVLLELEIIDNTGRFFAPHELNPLLPAAIRKRLISRGSEPAFVFSGRKNSTCETPVLLTQKDIRQFQLAKAAIKAGIECLLQKAEISIKDIDQLLLAGAFGNYLDPQNAIRTGLLPNIPTHKVRFVGNAAGTGAELALINRDCRKQAIRLAEKMEYIEIANQKNFPDIFSECLLFPDAV